MYSLIRPLLFFLEPETAHALTFSVLDYLPSFCFPGPTSSHSIKLMGLCFPHRIGLAAGLDKNGDHLDALAKIGFSFIEVGTVTPRAQEGNPKPRLFRLPKAQALINRMGFNNRGLDYLITNLKKTRYQGILGINIGKNKDTHLNHASADYLDCLRGVYQHASYVTINISSPNTPDLRQLQQAGYFNDLLKLLRQEQLHLADLHQRYVPMVVKLSPDETDETLKKMADIALTHQLDGIIATNTTQAREGVSQLPFGNEIGGLSGPPLFASSTRHLSVLKEIVGDAIVLIGSGGIDSIQAAQAKMAAGASLLQVYTGLIYHGPQLIRDLGLSTAIADGF